ncbi:MAG: hypothetical protein K0S74_1816 [Chlamydiales bacterium]|jgi:hypothetical protein|nr:hypothetical protein [Chlamydiales bacterium]
MVLIIQIHELWKKYNAYKYRSFHKQIEDSLLLNLQSPEISIENTELTEIIIEK